MSRKPRCRTCGKVLVGPLRGGRIYCDPTCWRSRTDPEVERRLQALAELTFIGLLVARRTAASEARFAEVQAEIDSRLDEKREGKEET